MIIAAIKRIKTPITDRAIMHNTIPVVAVSLYGECKLLILRTNPIIDSTRESGMKSINNGDLKRPLRMIGKTAMLSAMIPIYKDTRAILPPALVSDM